MKRIFIAALVLRAAVALITERWPIFPPYYYADAVFMDSYAARMADSWSRGEHVGRQGSAAHRFYGAYLAAIYRVAGHRPLAAKLVNAAAGAGAVAALYALAVPVFGTGPAAGAALLTAVWPSHVFFTSQLPKDALAMLFCYLALLGVLSRRYALALAALFITGFLRAYLMAVSAALLGGLLLRRRAWAALLLLVAAFGAQRIVAHAVLDGPLAVDKGKETDMANERTIIPAAGNERVKPLSPKGISNFRRIRQEADREWAGKQFERRIGTQLFPDETFKTWWDVALFLPKAAFYVLLMPLPLLYPLGDNLGRWAAAAENTALLLILGAAAVGAWRTPKTPERLALLGFFALMVGGSALLEFDLGSATRHKLLYLPLIFPFAFMARKKASATR